MMSPDPKKYAYRIRWSREDGEWVGTVAEFPSLSWLAASQEGALEGIVSLVQEVIEDMSKEGEPIPLPFAEQSFSGSIRLRVPPEQHRELAIRASEEGVSLNRYLCSLLSVAPQRQLVGATVDVDGNVVDDVVSVRALERLARENGEHLVIRFEPAGREALEG